MYVPIYIFLTVLMDNIFVFLIVWVEWEQQQKELGKKKENPR